MVLLAVLSLVSTAFAEGRFTLGAAFGPIAGPPSAGLIGTGLARINVQRFSLEAALGQGLLSRDLRTLAAVELAALVKTGPHLVVGAGFAHLHETPWEEFLAHPIATSAGTADAIQHRSGLMAALGWETRADVYGLGDRLHPGFRVRASWMPDSMGPSFYVGASVSLGLDLGRMARAG